MITIKDINNIKTGISTSSPDIEKTTMKLFHGESGAKGIADQYEKTFNKVLTVETSQRELMEALISGGDKEAAQIYKSKNFFVDADNYLKKKFVGEYDAIRYKNVDMPEKGIEFHDLADGKFYSESEDTAIAYAFQNRADKYIDGTTIPPTEEEIKSTVQKVTDALKTAKPLRVEQEAIYTAERGSRLGMTKAIGEKLEGEAGFKAELGALKGEIDPKIQFESIRNQFGQKEIDTLFKTIKDSSLLSDWEKFPARKGLAKLFGGYGGAVPTEGELQLLDTVFGKEFTETVLSKRDFLTKARDLGYEIMSLPKAMMATADLSAPLRQGIFLIGKPRQFIPAFFDMFKAFGSEKTFTAMQQEIFNRPTFELMKESKLALTDMGKFLGKREESFMSSLIGKIPVIGKVAKASNRAYVGFLNQLRADVFDDLISKAKNIGLNPEQSTSLLREISGFINNATGRGSLGKFEKAATSINAIFFSPRLMASRLNLLNPAYYVKASPFVRKEALKSLFSFLGIGATVLTFAKWMGSEVGADPRSADFGKIIIKDTRIDIWGGFQQYIRMASQLVSGQYISSATGKLLTLGEGYKPLTRLDILSRLLEAKEAPLFSFATGWLRGTNYIGEPFEVPKELGQRFIPMAIKDIYETARNNPDLIPISLLSFLGVGTQTYSSRDDTKLPTQSEKEDTLELSKRLASQENTRTGLTDTANLLLQELEKMPKDDANEEYKRIYNEDPKLGEKIKEIREDKKLGLTYVDRMIKQLGVENGERAKYIFDKVQKMDSREEKNSYIEDLWDKRIVTEKVYNQLFFLVNESKKKK